MSDLTPEELSLKASIEAEYRQMTAEDVTETVPLRERILLAWELESPKMWAQLQRLGVTDKAAFVAQENMWRRRQELLDSGYPVTDAREVAEREELMWEPEEPEPEDDSDLPTVLQDGPQNLKDRWRAQMEKMRQDEEDYGPA